jgi:outer membrane protein
MTTRPVRTGMRILAGCLMFHHVGQAQESSWIDDPFATRQLTSSSPGKAYPRELDPCIEKARPTAWTLLDVVNQALCHNPQTRTAWANARLQAAQVGIGQSAYLPTLSVNTSFTETQNLTSGSSAQSANLQNPSNIGQPLTQTRITPVVTFNYLLFDFGGRAGRLDNARYALEAADWSHNAALQSVMFSAMQAYYQLFSAQSAVDAARAAEGSSAEALKAARFRYEVGAAALADALQAQTAYAQAKVNTQRAEGDAKNALGTLANAMGLDPDPELKVVPPLFQAPDSVREADVRRLMEEARTLRPDLAAAEAQIKAAQANVQAAKAGGLPTLSLVGTYLYNYSSAFNGTQGWSVGLQLNVPLFTGFNNTYQIRAAREQVAVQEANRDQLEQSISLAVWTAFHNLNTARETLQSSEDLLASADQNEKVAMGRYKAGAGNIVDLLNAQASLANARFQRVQSQFNWSIAKAQLAQAIGRLDLSEIRAEYSEGSSTAHGKSD